MIDLHELEEFKHLHEIKDIIKDIRDIESLYSQNLLNELNECLNKICSKYPVEIALNNAINPVPPQSIQESAKNCIIFLKKIGIAKIAEYLKRK